MVAVSRFLLLICFVVVGLSNLSTAEPALPANADALVEEGITAYDAEDYQHAKDILLPLAQAGHPEAMHRIGRMYEGLGGVFPKAPNIECDWYEKAAHKGLPKSMYNLSICYNHGLGRPKNHAHMVTWRTKAAEHGFIPAMINLAALDPSEGEEYLSWMLMAQEHESAYAKVDLWLQGYKSESKMSFSDFICVSWNILLGDELFEYCD